MSAIDEFEKIRSIDMGAIFSPCRKWRWALVRNWDQGGLFDPPPRQIVFIGLNPSTADERYNDPTIVRLIDFADAWGFTGLVMLNAFAWRDTDPAAMKRADDPNGAENDAVIAHVCRSLPDVVACWGNHCSHLGRQDQLRDLLSTISPISCFGRNQDGSPKHPLYLAASTQRELLWPLASPVVPSPMLF